MPSIGKLSTPWKPPREERGNDPKYQSKEWKKKVDYVWIRDKALCQMCLEKGVLHPLTRGTKDIDKQGTVDHINNYRLSGLDDLDNLWLIGSRHHQSKSAKERS